MEYRISPEQQKNKNLVTTSLLLVAIGSSISLLNQIFVLQASIINIILTALISFFPPIIFIVLSRKWFEFVKRLTPYYFVFFVFFIAFMAGGARSLTNIVLFIVPFLAYSFGSNIIAISLIILSGFTACVVFWSVPQLDEWLMRFNTYPLEALIEPNTTYIVMYYIVFICFTGFSIKYDRENKHYQAVIKEKTLSIERSNKAIKQEAKKRSDLFVNIAHETKTPLTLISNYLDKYISSHESNQDLLIIKQNIEKLKSDMVNFLDTEKLRLNQLFYDHNQIFNLSEFLKKKIDLFRQLAVQKGINLLASIEMEYFVKADPIALDRVINNLLDNAIKFTPSGGSIKVDLNVNERIHISISDTGIGIPPEEQLNIFTAYHQVTHKKRNVQGLGLGLYITKQIIDSIGGTIELKSQLGQGSQFIVTLPLQTKPEQINTKPEMTIPVQSVFITQDQIKIKAFDKNKKTILLVEDNLQLVMDLLHSLEGSYNCYFAINGLDALEKLETNPKPDLIISDIMMDQMDGYEFHDNLLKDNFYRAIPFIYLTAKDGLNERLMGLSQGAVDFIQKPFKYEELKEKIKSWFLLIDWKESPELIEFRHVRRLNSFIDEYKLHPREKDILQYLLCGYQNSDISQELNISPNTVKKHIERIKIKVNISSKKELLSLLFKYVYQ